jgi:glycosyltransferase involved in cell wall biosynthesis
MTTANRSEEQAQSTLNSSANWRGARMAILAPSCARGYYWQPVFQELTKRFPDTVVFTGHWPGYLAGYENTFKVRVLRGYKYIVLKFLPSGADIGIIWAPPTIIWELMKFRPDVILTSAFSLWTLYALIYKVFARCRLMIGWEGSAPSTTYLDRPLRLRLRRIMGRLADAVYSNTRDGLGYLRGVLGIPDSKLSHCPCEVPHARALLGGDQAPLRYDWRPVFLFVGSISKRKGWRYLLDAAERLREEGAPPFAVVFAGEGPELPELRHRVAAKNLGDFIHVVGQVPYDCLGAYFQAADVFVFPTLEDTWGMVVLEAMAFGRAVLCSKYAGAKEVLQEGSNGFVFDPYNPEDLPGYMARFIKQPALIKSFGARSSEIIAPYNPERAAAILAGLVSKVLDPEAPVRAEASADATLMNQ